jgi:hypothetical protein
VKAAAAKKPNQTRRVTIEKLFPAFCPASTGCEVTAVIEQGKEGPVGIEADHVHTGRAHSEPAELRRWNANYGTNNRCKYEVVTYHHDGAVPMLLDLLQNCGPGTIAKLVAGLAAAAFEKKLLFIPPLDELLQAGADVFCFHSFQCAAVHFTKSRLLDDVEIMGIGNPLGGAHCPAQRAGIDGPDIVFFQSFRKTAALPLSFIIESYIVVPSLNAA